MTNEQSGIHIHAPPGYYRIVNNNVLVFFDLSGWYEPIGIIRRKKYMRIKDFIKKCRKYVKKQNGKFMSHKQGMKILMANIEKEHKYYATKTSQNHLLKKEVQNDR